MALALLVTSYFFITPQVDAQSRTDNAIGIGATAMVGGIAAALIAGELQEQHRNRLEQMAVTDYLKSKHKGENFKLSFIDESVRLDSRSEVSILAFLIETEDSTSLNCDLSFKPHLVSLWFLDDSWINENGINLEGVDVKYYTIEEWRILVADLYSSIFSFNIKPSRIYKYVSDDTNGERIKTHVNQGFAYDDWVNIKVNGCSRKKADETLSIDFTTIGKVMSPIFEDISDIRIDMTRKKVRLYKYLGEGQTNTFIETSGADEKEYRVLSLKKSDFSFVLSKQRIILIQPETKKVGVMGEELFNSIISKCKS